MGGSASKSADSNEDNMKCDYSSPMSLGDMVGTIQKEAEFIVSVISSVIMSNKGMDKDKELYDLVEQFFDHSNSLSSYCIEIESCLNKARDSQLNLHAAVQLYKEGRSDEASQELEKFKNSEDPFTGLTEKLEEVHQQHKKLAEKLELYKNMIKKQQLITLMGRIATHVIFVSSVLTLFTCQAFMFYSGLLVAALPVLSATSATVSAWVALDSKFKEYYDALQRQKDLVGSMITQGLIEQQNFNEIRLAAEDTGNKLRSLKGNAEFALEGDVKLKIGFDQIEKKMDNFDKSIEKLGECIENCRECLKKGREEIKMSMGTA